MAQLKEMCINFSGCSAFETMEGLQAITGMRRLQICVMDFSYSGLQRLEELGTILGAPTQLEELTLKFRGCKGITSV
eukprot:12104069-Heterocapsa_arctica.AAC.1